MLELLIEQRRRNLGGFEVGRVLPYAKHRMVGPFIFFDHMGPVTFPSGIPAEVDVRPHPHIGLSTITYLFEGEIMHRDSVGSEQPIRPREVNWMTAGKGITHSERFERARREGGPMHGIQAWVALPQDDEECAPSFAHYDSEDLPVWEERGAWCQLIAGEAFDIRSAVRTHSPMFYMHCRLSSGARVSLPDQYPERALYVADGIMEIGGRSVERGQMAILTPGEAVSVTAQAPAVVMALGGEPIGPRLIEWNFVSSSRERIDQAKADWRAGRMKLPDFDSGEYIPLPPEPGSPPNPMS